MNRSSDRPTGAKCPVCGTWGAKKSLFSVKCVNPSCRKYDAGYAREFQQNRIVGRSAAEVFHLEGNEHYALDIRYINFRGDELTYSADPSSGYIKKAHLVIRVAPRG